MHDPSDPHSPSHSPSASHSPSTFASPASSPLPGASASPGAGASRSRSPDDPGARDGAGPTSGGAAKEPPPGAPRTLRLSLLNIYETLAISWPTVVDAALGRVTKEECDLRLEHWSSEIVANAKIELEVRGREHMAPGQTYLVMSNHQSLYDIPVLFHVIGRNLRMVTKTELFKIPIFGKAMSAAGFIDIDRSNRQRAIESLAVAKRKLNEGVHVWIAPEGTRSKDGRLLPFKKGGFQLALDTLQPILPVTLDGTRHVLPAKGARSVEGAHVRVTIHRPIDPRAYATGDLAGAPPSSGADAGERSGKAAKGARERLMADVRRALESGL